MLPEITKRGRRMVADTIEYKRTIKFLDNVLDVLNRIGTSVELQDGKYIIARNNVKQYEIQILPESTVICETGSLPYVIEKSGARIKNKLWLIKFKLQECTEPKPFEKVTRKVRFLKNDVKSINGIIKSLKREDTRVTVLNETMLMKDYLIDYTVDSGTGYKIPYKIRLRYSGNVAYFGSNAVCPMDVAGIRGGRLKALRKKLDKRVEIQDNPTIKTTLFDKIRFKLSDVVLGRDRIL